MKRWHRHRPASLLAHFTQAALAAALAGVMTGIAVEACFASEVLLLRQNDSKIMKFEKMKRVWVQEPTIVDVVVTSYNELLVYSKAVGRTKLIVWDATARHEYAVEVRGLPTSEQVVRELSNILGRVLKYTIIDDKTIMVEGEVPTEAERDRISKVLDAKGEGLKILNLVLVPNPRVTPADEYQRSFEKLFPEQFRYSAIDPQTLVIEGEVGTVGDKQRMEKITAAAKGITVVDLVRCLETQLTPREQRIASIKEAVGPRYQYHVLEDELMVISGEASSEAERQRVDKIATAAAGDITIVNTVGLKTDTRPASEKYAEILKPVFGAPYRFTALGEDSLVIEGTAPTPAEEARVQQIVALLEGKVQFVNLVSTGPQTPGERAVAMLQQSLGDKYQVKLVGSDVAVVEGAALSAADEERIDALIAAIPQGAKVVNLVALQTPGQDQWEASRLEQALKPVLGGDLTYRVLDEETLMIEGQVGSAGERERAQLVLKELSSRAKILDLIVVRPGPNAMAESAAAKKAEALIQVLGDRFRCTAVDEKTVLVQGAALGTADKERLAGIIKQVAGEITVVDMILPDAESGTQTPAERTVETLKQVVPGNLQVVAIDDRTVLVEGIVPTSIDKERVDKIATAASQGEKLTVLSLVLSELQSKSPAARRIDGLRKILGDKYGYIVWDEETVLVDGKVDSQDELDKVSKILDASNKDWKVGNLVTYTAPNTVTSLPGADALGPMESPVESISKTIGEPYRVWHLKGNKLVVEGIAPDETAHNRLKLLLEAFQDESDIINLVTVAPTQSVPLGARAESLRAVLGDVFQVRTLQGKALVVEAVLRAKADAERAREIIKAMGTDVPIVDLITVADPAKRQILVHAKVLDINRGATKKLGVNWGQLAVGATPGTVSFGDQPFLMSVEGGITSVSDIAVNIEALKQTDQARVLAEPNLVVNEGEDASIIVGGEVPIPVPQLGTGAASVGIEYKEYGVVLRMKPSIMADGKTIKLNIEPEVSSIDTATQVSIGGISVPAFRTRKAKTIVDMPDGATLIIGGLIQNEQSKVIRSIPLLGQLPIIGQLFRSTEWQNDQRELLILVTPEILKTTQD